MLKMKKRIFGFCFFIAFVSILCLAGAAFSAMNTNIGVNFGYGLPIGKWADRWDPMMSGELNFRYEVTPGAGIVLITGLGKNYFTELSEAEIIDDSRLRELPPEYQPYVTTIQSGQSGSFKSIPVGFGLYLERLIGNRTSRIRGYGSLAMVVYHWEVHRDQNLYRIADLPRLNRMPFEDDWSDNSEGSNLGAQFCAGMQYEFRKNFFIDISAAYNFVDIGNENVRIAYWGLPARLSDRDEVKDSRMDYFQIRLGFRYGR